ncbi:MAG: DUF1572 family protein [bacterium]
MNDTGFGKEYLAEAVRGFQGQKAMAEKAFAQLKPEDFHWKPDAESNGVANLIQHLHGNMISRWTDFLTTDGDKPTRDRDAEFEDHPQPREELMSLWTKGWACLFDAVGRLTEDDLRKAVRIRGQELTAVQAIQRQLMHYANRVGQIVYIAKQVKGSGWKTLSIAKGQSKSYKPG